MGEVASSGRFTRHQGEQVLLGDLVLFEHADVASVAKHGRSVGDTDQFGDTVGDDQHRRAGVAQCPHLGKEPFGRIEVERCRALVEDEDLRLRQQCARYRDPLLEAKRQGPGERVRVDVFARKLLHKLLGAGDFALLRQRLGKEAVRSHEDVVDDAAFVGDEYLLVDSRDAERAALSRRRRRFAEDRDRPGIDGQYARHHLRKRALAATIAADDGMDLACAGREIDPVERPGGPEILLHVAHDDRLATELCLREGGGFGRHR